MSAAAARPVLTLGRVAVAGLRVRRPGQASGPLGAPYDPFDPAVIADPQAAFRRLHARPGLHPAGRGTYALAAHDDVRAAARAHDVLISGRGVTQVPAGLPMLLTLDRPRHAELRRLLAPHFTGRRAAALEDDMRRIAVDAVDRMVAAGTADAVAALAVPLPIRVIARLLGVPEDDLPRFRRWSDAAVEGFHVAPGQGAAGLRSGLVAARATLALLAYFRTSLPRLRAAPGDDVLSALLAADDLREDELLWLAMMVLVAGNETTTNLIGSLLLALSEDPELWARMRADRTLVDRAVDEAVRWGSPIRGLFRTAKAPYAVAGATVPAGARVLLLFGAANRDPRAFPDPDRFDPERAPSGRSEHLGFGAGIHFCLGAQLARAEARIALTALLDRVVRLEPAGRVTWRRNPTVSGPDRLPLRLVAA